MAITIFYYFFVLIIIFLLILNIVYPLLVPKYRLFFMFRKDKFKDAVEQLDTAKREEEIRLIKTEIENIKKSQHQKAD